MKEITDCPFCGSSSVYLSGGCGKVYVVCGKCGAFGPGAATGDRAKLIWNNSNDSRAMLVALVEVIRNRPVIANFLNEKGSKATWKMAQELCP